MPKPQDNKCPTCGSRVAPDYSLVVFVSTHCKDCGQIKAQFIESLTKLGISKDLKDELEAVLFSRLDDYSPWPGLRPKKKKPKRRPRRKSR